MLPVVAPAPAAASDGLLQTLLNVALTGIILYRPVFGGDPAHLVDLAYVQLNPAAQRMVRLPECPTGTFLALYPSAVDTGIFAFYRDTFESGTACRYDVNYQHDGLDNYLHLAAQRHGELFVVASPTRSTSPARPPSRPCAKARSPSRPPTPRPPANASSCTACSSRPRP